MVSESVNDTIVEKDTSGAAPAVEMALEQINDRPDLLIGYDLQFSTADPINSKVKKPKRKDTKGVQDCHN